ncbi:MAG: type II toxin-antitoxin system RelB/DinJ family antitoxin [Dehalococcoidia bacterium]|nr:type II toxin-antitoxin system RelB/DinJ family antitoxin [Dehalococcoidia bacterium]
MPQTTISIRIDEEVKRGFEKFCSDVGLNVSVAVNMYAKMVIKEQRLPFDVALDSPNGETHRAIDDVANRRDLSRSFSSVAELMEDLNTAD